MSFLEGFSRSLGNSLIEEDRAAKAAQRDRKEWEFRQQKLAEMEERLTKTRIAGVEYFEQGGKVMAQPVNAYGEPVGVPRPAREGEAEKYTQGREDRKRKVATEEASLRGETARAGKAEKDLANYDESYGLSKREAEAGIASRLASAESARASADLSRANAEFLRDNGTLPGRERKPGSKEFTDTEKQILKNTMLNKADIDIDEDISPIANAALEILNNASGMTFEEAKQAIELLIQRANGAKDVAKNPHSSNAGGLSNPDIATLLRGR